MSTYVVCGYWIVQARDWWRVLKCECRCYTLCDVIECVLIDHAFNDLCRRTNEITDVITLCTDNTTDDVMIFMLHSDQDDKYDKNISLGVWGRALMTRPVSDWPRASYWSYTFGLASNTVVSAALQRGGRIMWVKYIIRLMSQSIYLAYLVMVITFYVFAPSYFMTTNMTDWVY